MAKQQADIQKLLELIIKRNASDLHLTVGALATLRIDGELRPIEGTMPLFPEQVETLIYDLLTDEQKEVLTANKELDFSFALGEIARFRVNAYHQKGYLAAALRLIPAKIPVIEELGLPAICRTFTKVPQGFILVVGPTGHGKSTSLAAMINEINEQRADHIVTIEDPIEYVYPHKRSLISQRELNLDTNSWEIAIRSALRQDPDVVLVGEMRDYNTISAALTIAETGHLVFATLHTNTAAQTVDRIIDVFPEHQQDQVRAQLAAVLSGIISQRLVPKIGGGRVLATEVLMCTPAIRSLIRESKSHQIDNVIATSTEHGMMTMEQSLARLIKAGKISLETAQANTIYPEELMRILKSGNE